MSVGTQETKSTYDPRTVFNVPNQLTSIRLVLAIVLFALIAYEQYLAGMWVFIVAAGTDWIDGFYARRYNQVTTLGRILDPFVDKIIICGTFIFLAAIPSVGPLQG
jgi:CDP-diacylglycerol---glycerol-3-phosphate 3-phosphatidyltransferase